MREKDRLPSTLACLLLALAVAACGQDGDSSAAHTFLGVNDVLATAETVTVAGGEAVRIGDDPEEEEMPAVSGDRVVWVAGDPMAGPRSLVVHDLSEGTDQPIVAKHADQIRPDIDGDVVVWEDARDFVKGEPHDIFAFDVSTGEERQITETRRTERAARISGDRVVWVQRPGFLIDGFTRRRPGPGDVFAHDLASGATTVVSADSAVNEQNADISGDRVVWTERSRVMVRNLAQGTTRVVARGAIGRPIYISGSRVAYIGDAGDGQNRVLVKNIETGALHEFAPVDALFEEEIGGLSGDHLVWTAKPDGDLNVFFHDFATGETRRLTDHPADQVEADVDGDRVVWKDLRSGDGDIFLLELRVTIDQIQDRVEELRASGAIDNGGVANSLRKILENAAAARERGNLQAARNQLRAFIRHVEAQAGKHITRDAADELIGLARQAIEDLEDP